MYINMETDEIYLENMELYFLLSLTYAYIIRH